MVQWDNLKTTDLNIEMLELTIKELEQWKNSPKVKVGRMYLLPKDKKLIKKICGE